jgi:sulfate/thiosulfate-binding protein
VKDIFQHHFLNFKIVNKTIERKWQRLKNTELRSILYKKNQSTKDILQNISKNIITFVKRKIIPVMLMCSLVMTFSGCGKEKDGLTITNVSYDPTREFYEAYNDIFKEYYQQKTGQQVNIIQSHGGSGSQARSVVEGCNADVVTLALEHDITLIENTGLINSGWKEEFDKDSAPYTSTIVFLVRKGNEKNIKDWNDLIKPDVEVITPDPKSSGGACWNFLAALSYAKEKYSDEASQQDFLRKLYGNVSVLDSGARGSTTTFVENGKGDVLIAWENEAIATMKNYPDQYELVSPSVSILAQPSVAIVDDNVAMNKTEQLSSEYLSYLYSKDAQKLVAENGYRPSDEEVLKDYGNVFNLNMKLTNINDFGGWNEAYKTYFDDGALFDVIYN